MKFGVRSRGVRKGKLRVRSSGWGAKCSGVGDRGSALKRIYKNLLLFFIMIPLIVFCLQSLAIGSEKWAGVDESVVKKVAQEQGRKAWEPIINTDQGDLQLFLFLLAGAVGGFIAGYYWRILMVERATSRLKEKTKS